MFEVKVGRFSAFGVCFFFFLPEEHRNFHVRLALHLKQAPLQISLICFPAGEAIKCPLSVVTT